MTALEELFAAAMGATECKRKEALRLLRGEARLADPLEPEPMRPPLLLGMGEAASYLGVSRPTLWRIIKAGRLEKVELFPGSFRIRRKDVEELAMQRSPIGRRQEHTPEEP